jgi:hypothetical protein
VVLNDHGRCADALRKVARVIIRMVIARDR